jgi:peroxiredoxin
MKKYASFILFLIITIMFASCGSDKTEKNKAVIIGKYLPKDAQIFLKKVHANNVKLMDSADISVNPEFTFKFNSPDYALFRLECEGLYPLIVVARNGDTVRIEQTVDVAWPFKVEGNDESMLAAIYFEKLKRDEHRVDSLSAIFHSSQSHPDFMTIREELNREFVNIHESHKEWCMAFVIDHPASFASLIMINSFFREFLLFDQREDFGYFELVANAVKESMPENKYAIDLNEQVERIRKGNEEEAKAQMRLAPGKKVPEFEMKSMDGKTISPSDMEGKYLLIYFWAAVDAESRQINPFIAKLYEAYNKMGLEIMTISFDMDANVWQAAIELDALPGIHIDDASGPHSAVQKLFNIKMRLPTYFLIDAEGRIYKHGQDFKELNPAIKELITKGPNY